MIFGKYIELFESLKQRLGDETLVVSFASDHNNELYLSVSVHNSKKFVYNHGRTMQTCRFDIEDFERDVNEVLDLVVPLFKEVMEVKDVPTTEDAS